MTIQLHRNWWAIVLRGMIAILFGILLVTLGVRARRLDKELSDLTV